MSFRKERDTLGDVQVPDDALFGAQTQRAVENYPISGLREHPLFIRAFVYLKKAAALANGELKKAVKVKGIRLSATAREKIVAAGGSVEE